MEEVPKKNKNPKNTLQEKETREIVLKNEQEKRIFSLPLHSDETKEYLIDLNRQTEEEFIEKQKELEKINKEYEDYMEKEKREKDNEAD